MPPLPPLRLARSNFIGLLKRLRHLTEPLFCIRSVYLSHTAHRYDEKGVGDMDEVRQRIVRCEALPHPIIEAIRDVCARMDAVQSRFELESDQDLIEADIYELQSLRARYRYLLRVARADGIACQEKGHLWNE